MDAREGRSVHIVTRNREKLASARHAFSEYGIAVHQIADNYPEIQAERSVDIAAFTAMHAARERGYPVVREDHSLFINALGIPGPFTTYIERWLPAARLARILDDFDDRGAYFELGACYASPGGKHREYSYRVEIEFASKPRGTLSTGWNSVMMLKGDSRTLGEYAEEDRVEVWAKNFLAIARDMSAGKLDF